MPLPQLTEALLSDGKRIAIEDLREKAAHPTLRCPFCYAEVIAKLGAVREAHFAHRFEETSCLELRRLKEQLLVEHPTRRRDPTMELPDQRYIQKFGPVPSDVLDRFLLYVDFELPHGIAQYAVLRDVRNAREQLVFFTRPGGADPHQLAGCPFASSVDWADLEQPAAARLFLMRKLRELPDFPSQVHPRPRIIHPGVTLETALMNFPPTKKLGLLL